MIYFYNINVVIVNNSNLNAFYFITAIYNASYNQTLDITNIECGRYCLLLITTINILRTFAVIE